MIAQPVQVLAVAVGHRGGQFDLDRDYCAVGSLDDEVDLVFATAPDGRIFRGTRGGPLSESVYGLAWKNARKAALTAEELSL